MNVLLNPRLHKYIHRYTSHLDIHFNTETNITDLVCDLPLFGTIWFHPGVIDKILFVEWLKDKFIVAYDSDREKSFFTRHMGATGKLLTPSNIQ